MFLVDIFLLFGGAFIAMTWDDSWHPRGRNRRLCLITPRSLGVRRISVFAHVVELKLRVSRIQLRVVDDS